MNIEDYKVYELFINAIVSLLTLLAGISGGIYVEQKWKIVKRIKNRINQKGDHNQASDVIDSPQSSSQSAGRDAENQSGNGNVVARLENSPHAHVTITPTTAPKEDALRPPAWSGGNTDIQLSADAKFICGEIRKILDSQNVDLREDCENDYALAEDHTRLRQWRQAATLYIRTYKPILESLDAIGEGEFVAVLETHISKFESWNKKGQGDVEVASIIKSLEGELYEFLTEPR